MNLLNRQILFYHAISAVAIALLAVTAYRFINHEEYDPKTFVRTNKTDDAFILMSIAALLTMILYSIPSVKQIENDKTSLNNNLRHKN